MWARAIHYMRRAPNRGSLAYTNLTHVETANTTNTWSSFPSASHGRLGPTCSSTTQNASLSPSVRSKKQSKSKSKTKSKTKIQKCHAARETERNSSAGCSRFPLFYLLYSLFHSKWIYCRGLKRHQIGESAYVAREWAKIVTLLRCLARRRTDR